MVLYSKIFFFVIPGRGVAKGKGIGKIKSFVVFGARCARLAVHVPAFAGMTKGGKE